MEITFETDEQLSLSLPAHYPAKSIITTEKKDENKDGPILKRQIQFDTRADRNSPQGRRIFNAPSPETWVRVNSLNSGIIARNPNCTLRLDRANFKTCRDLLIQGRFTLKGTSVCLK